MYVSLVRYIISIILKFNSMRKAGIEFINYFGLEKFFSRALINTEREIAYSHRVKKPTAVLIGFSNWKVWMHDVLPEYHSVFLGFSPRLNASLVDLIPRFCNPTVFCWSYKFPEGLEDLCQKNNIPMIFVEDGFIRGAGLGILKTNPLSLVFDRQAMHFDSQKNSDLDDMLNNHIFDNEDVKLARVFRSAFANGVTKYIKAGSEIDLTSQLELENQHVVLVLGQVEGDLSVRYGAARIYSAYELVHIAVQENPDSRILFRPHPETFYKQDEFDADLKKTAGFCEIIGPEWSLTETLVACDKVYTVTSFSGFEAALMDKEVHLFGLPFYGGWGFTNDRHEIDTKLKRTRKLTPDQVLSVALGRYPSYFNPVTMEKITARHAVSIAEAILFDLAEKAGSSSKRVS